MAKIMFQSEKEMEESTQIPMVKSLETENRKEKKQSWLSKFFKIKVHNI